jgi:eukaryotic-like serine/threonine-protein kinase
VAIETGVEVGKYRIGRKLGSGAFGAVWLAQNRETGEPVAIKVLLKSATSPGDHVVRFKREAENLKRVRSDHVAKIIEFVDSPVHGFMLVMEFIEGDLLTDVLLDTSLSLSEAIELGIHISQGLVDMHAAGVIHRDIKPSNVIIRPLETGLSRAVIFDLGLSRFSANVHVLGNDESSMDLTATASKVALGTPAFMAPEQVLDAKTSTAASDVYATGVVLFLAASGRFPFEGDEREVARRKLMEEAPKLELPRLDRASLHYIQIIGRAIRRRPEDRYQRADELYSDLVELRSLLQSMPAPDARFSPFPPTVEVQSGWNPSVPKNKSSSGLLPAISMAPERSTSQPPLLSQRAVDERPSAKWTVFIIVVLVVLGLGALFAYAIT